MDIFPTLYSNRLILRKIDIKDIPSLVKYANNKKISDWIINIPYPFNEPQAVFRISYIVEGFKKKSRFVFSIILKEKDEFIGEIGLHLNPKSNSCEIGYWVAEPFWNKGIATEAIREIITFAFNTVKLDVIIATCHQGNYGSIKALKNNFFRTKNINGNVILFQLARMDFEFDQNSES